MTRWLKVQQPTRVANKRLVNLLGTQRPEGLARPGCFAKPNYFADVAIVVDAMAMMISVASMTTYVTFNFRNSAAETPNILDSYPNVPISQSKGC